MIPNILQLQNDNTMDYEATLSALSRNRIPGEALNALYNKDFGWVVRRARKEHTDELGVLIHSGDEYYHRRSGRSVMEVQKLSIQSLNLIALILFEGNYEMTKIAKNILSLRQKEAIIRWPVPASQQD